MEAEPHMATWITVDGPSPKGLTSVSLSSLLPADWLDEAEQISPVVQAIYKSSASRSGKWSAEEVHFADVVIEQFALGLLRLKAHTTLRSVLSTVLQCDPMRISKKFPKSSSLGKKLFIPASAVGNDSSSLEQKMLEADSARKSAFFDFLGSLDATGAPSKPVTSSRGSKKRRRDSAHESVVSDELGAHVLQLNAGVASGSSHSSKPRQPQPSHQGHAQAPYHQRYPHHSEASHFYGHGQQSAHFDNYPNMALHDHRSHSGHSTGRGYQGGPSTKADYHGGGFAYSNNYPPSGHHQGYYSAHPAQGFYPPSHDPHHHGFRHPPPMHPGAGSHASHAAAALGSLHLTPDVARALALQLLPILRESEQGYAPAPADAPVMGGYAGAGRVAQPHHAPAPPTGPPEFAHVAGPSDMHLAAELASAVSSRPRGGARGGHAGSAGYYNGHHGSIRYNSGDAGMHQGPAQRPRSDSVGLDLDLLLERGGAHAPHALATLASRVQRPPQPRHTNRENMSNGALNGDGGRFSPAAVGGQRYSPPTAASYSPPAAASSSLSPPPRGKHSPVQDRDAAETLKNMAEGSGSDSGSRTVSASDADTTAAL